MSRPPLGSTLNLFGLQINWYSLLIMAGIAVGVVLATREEKRLHLPKDTILDFALLAIPLGLVGARLYYVLFSWGHFADDPLEILRIWNGGLAIYGGILGGMLAAYIVACRRKISFWSILDACMPALALGQAIGRWGNYANMEAYGMRIYAEAAQFFPLAVEIPITGANGTVYWYWHMATFFYESVWCLVIFGILMWGRREMRRKGDVTFWYLLLYCAGRTVIEGLRDDSLMVVVVAAQVRVSQVLSAVVCVAVAVMFFLRLYRARRLHFADYLAWALIALGIACTFVGEFERNAYQMLFIPAQALLGGLLAADIAFLVHYLRRARSMHTPAVYGLVAAALCAAMLLAGIGRLGEGNGAFVALRQALAMGHVVLGGAWFYLRCGKPRRERAEEETRVQEEETYATA